MRQSEGRGLRQQVLHGRRNYKTGGKKRKRQEHYMCPSKFLYELLKLIFVLATFSPPGLGVEWRVSHMPSYVASPLFRLHFHTVSYLVAYVGLELT